MTRCQAHRQICFEITFYVDGYNERGPISGPFDCCIPLHKQLVRDINNENLVKVEGLYFSIIDRKTFTIDIN